jgi:hypothetical protein
MNFFYPTSSFENPFLFFEFIYSEKGQSELRKEYLSYQFDLDEFDPVFDLEKDVMSSYHNDSETGEEVNFDFSFISFLNSKLSSQIAFSLSKFSLRIDSCNSKQEEIFVHDKFEKRLYKLIVWVEDSKIPFKKENIKFLKRFVNDLKYTFEYMAGLTVHSLLEIHTIKLKKIIADLVKLGFISSDQKDRLLDFFLSNDIKSFGSQIQIKCDNRQFHFIIEKFLSIGFPQSVMMKDITESNVFLRKSGKGVFTRSTVHNASSDNKVNSPKNEEKIDQIFSQF